MQVVPQVLESVNGSDVNMGCANVIGTTGGVTFCGRFGAGPSVQSYLMDDISPAVDTTTHDWASQLVTVRKNYATTDIPFDHVVLTFGFDTAVSLTSIELDLFLCPEWNIGAPYISVYGDEKSGLIFKSYSEYIDFLVNFTPSQSSCNSLSTFHIPLEEDNIISFFTWHVVVSFALQPNIEWVHVGEIRFIGTSETIPSEL